MKMGSIKGFQNFWLQLTVRNTVISWPWTNTHTYIKLKKKYIPLISYSTSTSLVLNNLVYWFWLPTRVQLYRVISINKVSSSFLKQQVYYLKEHGHHIWNISVKMNKLNSLVKFYQPSTDWFPLAAALPMPVKAEYQPASSGITSANKGLSGFASQSSMPAALFCKHYTVMSLFLPSSISLEEATFL